VSSLADLYSGTFNLGAVSPLYTAPEAFVGRISPASDQYSLAIAYHELLTGAFPFTGKNFRQLAMQHSCQPPDLDRLPVAERPIGAGALSKAPGERSPSCTAFIGELRARPASAQRLARVPRPSARLSETLPPSAWMTPPAGPCLELPGHRLSECVGRSALGE